MSKFHVNPETGNAGACSATAGRCPFGGEAEHYSTAEDARKAYEKVMSGATWLPAQGPIATWRRVQTEREALQAKVAAAEQALSPTGAGRPGEHSAAALDSYRLAAAYRMEARAFVTAYPEEEGGVEEARLHYEAAQATTAAALQHIHGVSKELKAAQGPERNRVQVRWDLLQEEYYAYEEEQETAHREYFNRKWRAEDEAAKAERGAR